MNLFDVKRDESLSLTESLSVILSLMSALPRFHGNNDRIRCNKQEMKKIRNKYMKKLFYSLRDFLIRFDWETTSFLGSSTLF